MKWKLLNLWVILFLVSACYDKAGVSSQPDAKNNKNDAGEQIFISRCKVCHGIDGKLQLNGAKDITASLLNIEERKLLIRNGKNTMTPFEGILTEEEIALVARYTLKLGLHDSN